MKKLFASCAAIALMAGPVFAQATYDPTNRDQLPGDPTVTDETDPAIGLEGEMPPPVAEQLPPETGVTADVETEAEEADPLMEAETDTAEGEPVMEAEVYDDTQDFAETQSTDLDIPAGIEVLEASVDVDELPEEYSTDDLNAIMLAEVNDVGNEISEMNFDSDGLVPEGQGDIDTWETEEDTLTAPEDDAYMTPEEDFVAPEEDTFVAPEDEGAIVAPQDDETFVTPESDIETEDDYVLPENDPEADDPWTEPEPF